MGSLSKEPSGHVGSADELMAIAHALEEEASKQYARLAERMRREGEDALSNLFASLSRIEQKHADQIDARALRVLGKKPDPKLVRWELPENFDEEEARSYLLTPYRALAIAVRNEERAFAFYTYLAAYADEDRLRQLAEESAKDELDHAALLRRERRKAWRSEREAPARILRRIARAHSLEELLTDVVRGERAAATAHRSLAYKLANAGQAHAANLFEQAAADEQSMADDAESRLGGAAPAAQPAPALDTIRQGLRLLEDSFEHYSLLAEHVADEASMNECQTLSERALHRLSYVRGSIDNVLISDASALGRLARDNAPHSGKVSGSVPDDRP